MENLDPKTTKLLQHLQGKVEINRNEDPLLDAIEDWKAEINSRPTSDERQQKVWNRISGQMNAKQEAHASVHTLNAGSSAKESKSQPIWWAAAAAILIVSIGLWFLLPTEPLFTEYVTAANSKTIELEDGTQIQLRPYSNLQSIDQSKKS